MRHFYYLKTTTEETVYQDEEIAVTPEEKVALTEKLVSKEPIVATKSELLTTVSSHKLTKFDAKTEQTVTVDAKDASCLVMWDGLSPYYEVVKGTAPEAVPFLGWPQVSKDDYVPPVDEIIPE